MVKNTILEFTAIASKLAIYCVKRIMNVLPSDTEITTMIKRFATITVLMLFFASSASFSATQQEKGIERITLQKTDVIGSQELPRIVSIISWKKTKPTDLPLLHKQLKMDFNPIDEKEFSREVAYRQQMKGQ